MITSYLNRIRTCFLLMLFIFLTMPLSMKSYAQTRSITPNSIGGGNLPNGFTRIIFTLADGNWVRDITLPTAPANNTQVDIISNAAFPSMLNTRGASRALDYLEIRNGDRYQLTYNSADQRWVIAGESVRQFTPNQQGGAIPDRPGRLTFYRISNGNWINEISLPQQANDGDIVVIDSAATWSATLRHNNLMYASTTTLNTGDEFYLRFSAELRRWVMIYSSPRAVVPVANMARPTGPNTLVALEDNNRIASIRLPRQAGDRDRITIRSNAGQETRIENGNELIADGPMTIRRGQEYVFVYIAERGRWATLQAPDTVYQARDLGIGNLPALLTPRTVVNFGNGNFVHDLTLPAHQPVGSRVLFKTTATWSFNVIAGNQSHRINTGEIVSFMVNSSGQWVRETVTIDMLLLYSDRAANRYGANVMRARLIEGLNLTNEALENSRANFRFRIMDVRQVTARPHWTDLREPLSELRSDATVQGWRNQLRADGIYYEGTEAGCGWAYMPGSAFNMIGVGSTNCGTTVLRHELGHNMGLAHAGSSNSFNQGYGLLRSIMGGNAIPYFSNPNRYTFDAGLPIGIPGQIDGVRHMNGFSSAVANFR
jgi:hypothetical protein